MKKRLKILIFEDSKFNSGLIERKLNNAGIGFISLTVNETAAFEHTLLSFKPDVIISQHSLDEYNFFAVSTLHKQYLKYVGVYFPYVFPGTMVREEGADENILNDPLKRLLSSIDLALNRGEIEKGKKEMKNARLLNMLQESLDYTIYLPEYNI